ncbi:hypothetical protein [Prauserella flavalba]|uniref:hypothetical protein n=1 Tax=Prauserella flavalba TaxID=1477506 RepID=UPI0036E74406
MHDRRHASEPTIAVEDVISDEILADELVDDEYLREVFREPRRYLPPPGTRAERPEDDPPPEPEKPFARRAKLAALLVAVALLVASIIIAASMAGQSESQGEDVAEPLEITGAAALGGFTLAGQDGKGGASADTPVVDDAAPVSGGKDAIAPAGEVRTVSQQDDTGEGGAAGTPARGNGKVSTVREFYALVNSSPDQAVRLLGPALAAERDTLVRAWRSMESVEVEEVHEQRDGSVRAVVTMIPQRGEAVRVTQQLDIGGGRDGRIREVKLLSAQPY